MHDVMAAYVERGEIPGIVTAVARRGRVEIDAIGTTAFGRPDPVAHDTIFRIASMTKPIVGVAAMTLVEDDVLNLDDPVERYLPELTDRRVLVRPDGPLDQTVPARRPVTTRDLLTFRLGFGLSMAVPFDAPIMAVATKREVGLAPPRMMASLTSEQWLTRFSELPLMFQPGEQWTYQTSATVLGILIARAAGQPLGDYLSERIFGPLGMIDTGFAVPATKRDRFATGYVRDSATGELAVSDVPGEDSRWAQTPPSPDGGGDLVSTVDDYLAFAQMMASGGGQILSPSSVAQMTTDHLTPDQSTFDPAIGWGFAMSVTRSGKHTGRYGWSGGLGSHWFNDPAEDLIAILLTQRSWETSQPPSVVNDFIASAYAG